MAAGASNPLAVRDTSKKSVLASGAASFFFGPLGWLYAGSFKEAIPASLAYLLVGAVLPHFLFMYVAGVTGFVSAVAGVLYAWSFNRSGRRETLLLKDAPTPPSLNP